VGVLKLASLLNDRVVQVLLLVVGLNLAAFVLLWRLDLFVHVDSYDYGLEFSYGWIADYWHNNAMGWGLLGGTTVLAALSFIPKYIYSQEHTKFSRYVGVLLSVLALVYQGLSVFFLLQVSNIVQSQLYNFGLTPNSVWISTITDLNLAILVLMVGGLIALIVPVTKNLDIINSNKKRAVALTLDRFLN
jgi:hypothetical protein